ncbi:MAG TPA: hypothetical protein VMQ93_16045, partial [Novosphingobium sp.]|nr:hypothetical protein [Novosphingobium sp.]
AGTGTGATGADQIVVNARALTIVRADAFDGSIAATASHGLLGIDTGNAAQDVTLVKRNDDLASLGSDTTTDILKVGELSGTGGSLSAGGAITVRSETSLILNTAAAQGGDILATAAGDMLVTRAIASTGSIGLYGGTWIRGDIGAPFAPIDGTLTAAGDVTIRAAGDVQYREISAGDDVDILSTGGDILIRNITSTGLGAGGSSVRFGPAPGLAGAVTVLPGEDAALTGATIRLRAANGSILASTLPGLIRTIGTGDILVNAFDAVRLDDIAAGNGSLGIRAGGSIATGDLSASHDIAALGGTSGALAATDVTIASALAGDDLAVTALDGDIVIGNGIAQGIVGRGGTSVAFTASAGSANAVGVAFGETPVFVDGTASLRSEIGDIDATSLSTLRGDVLVNAAGAVSLGLADAGGGSVGVLAGGTFTAGTLIADADITALAGTAGAPVRTDIFIASATAGDDIDLTALNGNLTLTDGAANGGGITGNSVTFEWAPGVDGAVRTIASEDMQLGASTLRLRSQSGDIFSTGTLASPGGNVLVNAFGNVGLAIVDARSGAAGDAGTLGILAGGRVDAASLFATRDIVVQSGSLSPGGITIGSAIAGDDIDLAAITGDLALSVGTSLGSAGSGGTSIVFIDAPGGPLAVGTSPSEDLQLGGATIRLRAEAGNIASLAVAGQPALTGTLRTEGEGDVLVNAFGSAALGTVEATSGSIGILAGGQVAATTLTALRDIGIRGGTAGALAPTDVTVTTATAGDDIDIEALNGNLVLTTGTSTGAPGTGGTSVAFIAAPGVALPGTGAVTVDAAEALPAVSSITLRSQVGDVTAATLHTQGTGHVFVNAARNATVGLAQADGGSIGLLAGTDAAAGALVARVDIGISAGRDALVTTARAGDDIDVVAGRNLALLSGTSLATGGTGGSSVVLGTAGVAGATAVDSDPANEDPQLAAATIRLRAAGGSIAGEFATPLGTTLATASGDILLNAAGDVTVRDANAGGGSIGALAGGAITATTLVATRDIGARARGNVTITAATAGDDIDVVSLTGNVVLTDGTATGLGTGGIRPTFPGSPGSIGAVAIEGGEDAQLGGSAIRLRAEAGSVTSTGTLSTQRAGDILVNASADVSLATVNASGGSIGVLAGGQVAATTLTASRDIGVQGGTGVGIGSATAGDDIDVVALAGNLVLTDGTANGTSGTGGTSVRYRAGVAPGSLDAVEIGGEDAQLGGSTIRLRAAQGNVTSAGTLSALGTGEVLVNAFVDTSLATVNASGGSIGVLAGGQVSATTLTASRDIGVQGGTIGAANATDVTIASATAGDDIDVVALNGNLALAGGTSTGLGAGGTSLVFTGAPGSTAAVAIGAEDAQLTAATIRLRAQVGDVTSTGALLAQGTGNVLVNAADAATLNAATATAGSIGVLAGGQVTATSLTASRDVGVQSAAGITVGTASAGDDIDMVALGGNLALANGTSTGASGAGGTSVSYGPVAGAAAAVVVGSGEDAQLAGAGIRLRAAAGNVTSTGTLRTQGTGDVLVNARGDVTLATTTASAGSVALLAGRNLTAATTSASEDVAARAATDATLTTITAGDDIEITASGLVTTGAGRIASGGTGLDARHGLLDTAQAGQVAGITLAAGDARGPKGLPAGSDLANAANGRSITIEAANVAIQGILETTGRITLRNTGTAPTVVGDGTITTGASFALANAELARLRSSTLVVDSGTRALELGTLTIDPATGTVDTRFLTTGAVEITGAVTVAGTAARTLQIGGLFGELGDDAGTVPLASEIVARIDRTSRPRIDAGSAHVDLRGAKILFGTSTMVAEYIGKTNDEIAAIVANPTSKLYSEATAQPLDVFLTARQVTVGYRNFALFQNTDINLSTGVLINSPPGGLPDQTALALRLVSTGEGGNNSFAMFGVVNNFSGTPAALLTNEAIEIVNPTGDPNDFRVTRASSRINGCVIGAPDRGCLATDIPQPNFNLYDERKVALFDVEDEGTIAVSPLIGRGNDGLIVNVADAPVGIDTIECRPEDPSCPAKEGN